MISKEARITAAAVLAAGLGLGAAGNSKAQEINRTPKILADYCQGSDTHSGPTTGFEAVSSTLSSLKTVRGDRLMRIEASLPERVFSLSTDAVLIYSPQNLGGDRVFASNAIKAGDRIVDVIATQVPAVPNDQIPDLFLEGQLPVCKKVFVSEIIFQPPVLPENISLPGKTAAETFANIYKDISPVPHE